MPAEYRREGLILLIAAVIIFLSLHYSFAATTTYTYDDVNHKVTVERGTQGASATYGISGIITDGSGGPLSGVSVSLVRNGTVIASTSTDPNGFYGFMGLNNGSYTLSFSKTGYTFSQSSRQVTINGSDAIAQDLTACAPSAVRIVRGPLYYVTLQEAYNAATNGDIIQCMYGTFVENVSVNKGISVTLQGGYDCGYTTNIGKVTYIKGMLRTFPGGGTLTISNFNLTQ